MSPDDLLNILDQLLGGELIRQLGLTLEDQKDKVLDLNRAQLLAGERSDGSEIGQYRPFTIAARQKKGLQTSHIDLRYEGDFQREMDLEVRGDEYVIYSHDFKNDKLVAEYGVQIFGLNPENLIRAWNEYLHDPVVRNLASRYNLSTSSR